MTCEHVRCQHEIIEHRILGVLDGMESVWAKHNGAPARNGVGMRLP